MKKKDILISLAIIAASGLALLYYSQRKGFVGIDAGGAEALLHLGSSWPASTIIATGDEPAAIGARIYWPQFLSLSMVQDGHTWRIVSRGPWGNLSKIKVRKNEATAIKLGPPFLIKPEVNKHGLNFLIRFVIIGQSGEQYESLITKDGRAVTGAKIKIVDETGNVLKSGSFEYG
jgi:hypothetical protein